MTVLWTIPLAYLIGAIPTGYLLVKLFRGSDIRDFGSGNIGATNVSRMAGLPLGVLVLAIDVVKGFLAVWITARAGGDASLWPSLAAFAVVLGNTGNVFLGFRGGKGLATAAGALLRLAPLPTLTLAPVFFVTAAVSRHVSAGSIVAAAAAPLAVWLIDHPGAGEVLMVGLASGLILWRHRENMERIRQGTEGEFSWRRRRGKMPSGGRR
jgi:glycerol-3-phosphate acyltransferase PlsY